MTALLSIRDLHVKVGDREVLRASRSMCRPARCTPSWVRTARARARSPCAGRQARLLDHIRQRHLCGARPARAPAEERARAGLFLGFQYPVEIPGVNNVYLLRAALNAARKHRGQPEIDAFDFLEVVRGKAKPDADG
jgi:Fe-S cluster assembly ATP-binding protein